MTDIEKLFGYIEGGYNPRTVKGLIEISLERKQSSVQMLKFIKSVVNSEVYEEYDNEDFKALYRRAVNECDSCHAINFNPQSQECDFCNGVFNGETVDIEVIGTVFDSRIPKSSITHAKNVIGTIIDNVNPGDRLVIVYVSKGVRQILELE